MNGTGTADGPAAGDPRARALWHLRRGHELWGQQRLAEALREYQRASELQPNSPDVLHALGTAQRCNDQVPQSMQTYARALALRPDSHQLHNDMGRAQTAAGQFQQAIESFQKSISLRPDYPLPHLNLGSLLLRMGRAKEASQILQRLVQLDPRSPRARCELGTALAKIGEAAAACGQLRAAVELDPNNAAAWCNLALTLEENGQIEPATEAMQHARRLLPQSAIVKYHLSALSERDSPPACPPEYLVELFDGYAERFDDHLFERLQYRGPQLLREAIGRIEHSPLMDIADLGCGTGMAGPIFRPLARTLIGVDVAGEMVRRAQQRGTYDQVVQDAIEPFLKSRPASFELLLAADVLIYIGDIRGLIWSAAQALRPAGIFAFTIETIESGDYVLRRSRRYAHSENYVSRLAREGGFDVIAMDAAIIRAGEGPRVAGAVVVLRRPSSS